MFILGVRALNLPPLLIFYLSYQCIIHAGLLACLGSVLANNHQKSIKKEVCRIIIDISHCGRSTQVTFSMLWGKIVLTDFWDLILCCECQADSYAFEHASKDLSRELACDVYLKFLLRNLEMTCFQAWNWLSTFSLNSFEIWLFTVWKDTTTQNKWI